MAVIGTTALTYMDWAKRVEDGGKAAMIIELLSQTNEIMTDMLVVEGNLPTGHKTTVRTGLPSSSWRLYNTGVPTSKSTTAQIIATCGNLEAESQIDVDIAALNGNSANFRLSEVAPFLESMNQTMAATLIYGNESINADRFTGFAPFYNTVSAATAQSAYNVIDAGGTGSDNTSIWIVCWGPNTVHGIFPKGKITGLNHQDKGQHRVYDSNNNPYWAWVDHYKWELGLAIRDWRYVVRICNIDVSDLATGSAANLINLLIRGLQRMPTTPVSSGPVQSSDAPSIQGAMGQTAIYVNRTLATYLDLQATNKTNVLLQLGEFNGRPVTRFRGIPIRIVDAILNNEARVV